MYYLLLSILLFTTSSYCMEKSPIEGDIFIMPNTFIDNEGKIQIQIWATSRDEHDVLDESLLEQKTYISDDAAWHDQTAKRGIGLHVSHEEAQIYKELALQNQAKARKYMISILAHNWRYNPEIDKESLGVSDHWQDHGHPLLKKRFPSFLPYELLKDKKEGDIIDLTIGKQKVRVRCKQKDYRYSNHGLFEQALERAIKHIIKKEQ